jgi:NHLM bacteriocin system ABC transporter, ATP-binding protein
MTHAHPTSEYAALFAHLARDGEPVIASASAPFLLTEPDLVWWIEAGSVDVFSVRLENGQPTGSRRPFCSVAAGAALFGFGPALAQRALLAVPGPDTRLRRINRASLRTLARDASFAPAVAHLLDTWITAVSTGVSRDVPARIDVLVEPDSPQPLPVNARFRARRHVLWLPPRAGEFLFIGMEETSDTADARFPVAPAAWLQTLAPATPSTVPTAAVIADDATWRGFAAFQTLVARCEALNRQLAEVDDLNRQRDRAAAGERANTQALDDLAAVLDGAIPPAEAAVDDPLFLACSAVGRAQGIHFLPPPELLRGESPAEPLAAIVRSTRIRSRAVALDPRWWKQDTGPMLGWLAQPRRPVALLPAPAGGYTLHDPTHHTTQPITAAVASQLETQAHVFYRTFAQTTIAGRELLRFGAHGLRPEIARLLSLGLAGGLLSTLPALATALVFDSLVPAGASDALVQLALGLIAVALAAGIFEFTRGLALLRIEGRFDARVQAAVIDRLLKLPATFFRNFTSGDLAQRALGVTEMRRLLAHALVAAGLGNLFAGVNLVVLAFIDLRLAFAACGLLALPLAFTAINTVRQLRVQRRVAAQQGFIAGLVLQFISGIAKLRVAAAEDLAFSAWARPFARQKKDAVQARRFGNRILVANAVFPLLASVALYWLAAPDADGAVLSVGQFLAFMTAFTALFGGMLALTAGLASALNLVPLLERLQPILHAAPEDDTHKLDPGTLSGRIELSHVSFRYGAGLPLVLDDVSLEVAPGEFVAIVGESGSGKSTLLRLLIGFETPESGTILYDGQDASHLDVPAVRRQLGVVLQTSQPTAGTIFSNVAGSRAFTEADVWEALRLAGLEAEVREMPMGLHTVLPVHGGVFSGGQRQRLMIARAIVSRPRILLFDEATSALDNRTQAIVTASLEQLAATRLVIAHRLSTVRRADRIVVMAGGKIVQSGRYDDLLAQPGPFATLAARQQLTSA